MAEQKTKPTAQSVDAFLSAIPAEQTRDDCYAIIKIMSKVTGSPPTMWGANIVGLGRLQGFVCSNSSGQSKPIRVYCQG